LEAVTLHLEAAKAKPSLGKSALEVPFLLPGQSVVNNSFAEGQLITCDVIMEFETGDIAAYEVHQICMFNDGKGMALAQRRSSDGFEDHWAIVDVFQERDLANDLDNRPAESPSSKPLKWGSHEDANFYSNEHDAKNKFLEFYSDYKAAHQRGSNELRKVVFLSQDVIMNAASASSKPYVNIQGNTQTKNLQNDKRSNPKSKIKASEAPTR